MFQMSRGIPDIYDDSDESNPLLKISENGYTPDYCVVPLSALDPQPRPVDVELLPPLSVLTRLPGTEPEEEAVLFPPDSGSTLEDSDTLFVRPASQLQTRLIVQQDATSGWRSLALGLLGIGGLLQLITLSLLIAAVGKPATPYVVMSSGVMQSLEEQVGSKRSPELIKLFVRDAITNIFTTKNTLPQKGNPPDPGVVVGEIGKAGGTSGKKISTTAYRYTLALNPSFAASFRVALADYMDTAGANQASSETAYVPSSISEPKQIAADIWTVDIVGSWLISNSQGKVERTIPLNKTVAVKAVPPIRESEVAALYQDKGIAKAVAQIRASGLEIININSLK
jgi:hypothetical protein